MGKRVKIALVVLAVALVSAIVWVWTQRTPAVSLTLTQPPGLPVRYDNTQYGLTFFLPAGWQGYSILTQQWKAYLHAADFRTVLGQEHGPIIILRNPRWKEDDHYQDIPITVLTHRQMVANEQDRMGLHAHGGLGELWHNRNYVFALYNLYGEIDIQNNGGFEVKGAEEVTDIFRRNWAANGMSHPDAKWAWHSTEHDWRLPIRGYSFGLIQEADSYDDGDSGLNSRTTTIYVGPFGEVATGLRAPFIAIALLLLFGTGSALLLRGLWHRKGEA